jgi:FAD-dependent urate hydroxylase
MTSRPLVAVIGAGPYGLSLAAHLAARKIEHRVFGQPMAFWSQIARAGRERYLKSYCFGTNISSPAPGSSFADYNGPRGLETFEPCSIENFADYGLWFQARNVGWVEPVDVVQVERTARDYAITLANGERLSARHVVVATGLASFAHIPSVLSKLPAALTTHSSAVERFAAFKGLEVAVVGAGQSALEAAALLREAGANPQLLIRKPEIRWMKRDARSRSLWRRVRSPISGLGSGPKAWALTNFPGTLHHLPESWRTNFVKTHLPPEGAWWLRSRVENQIPVHAEATIVEGRETGNRVALRIRSRGQRRERQLVVDRVVAGTGYVVDMDRIGFLHPGLRSAIDCHERAPRLDSSFQSSVPGLRFIGPTSAMSFGPLFRFVVGADYTARKVASHLASEAAARW